MSTKRTTKGPGTPGPIVDLQEHTPEYLAKWVATMRDRGFPERLGQFFNSLATDYRLREFWSWVAATTPDRVAKYGGTFRSSFGIAQQARRATRLPGKPGDMTPAQRNAYFAKVRKHAMALQELLGGTRFDNDGGSELSERALTRTLDQELGDWGDDEPEEGHVIAFHVSPEGRFRLPYDYPEGALWNTLTHVQAWTCWDDNWDGSIFGTSAPIAQANANGLPALYFACVMHDWFKRCGVEIPFKHLATLANVALELEPDAQVDEETVRKQVRRHEARQAARAEEHDCPF